MMKPVFNVIVGKQEDNFTQFVCEPLERGYGHTLGNALRRVLLSSIPGHAITSVKISGVDHQFSTLKGVTEDIVEILLNIKEIRVKSSLDDVSTMSLSAKGGVVTAADIKVPSGLEIVNPTQHIATLSDATKLEIEFTVEKGMGYSAAQDRTTSDLSGELLVDALFTPIMKVAYDIEETRVGRRTDFDRLILKVWTNGTIEAKAALDEAASVLIAHFEQVINPTDVLKKVEAPVIRQGNEVDRLTIEELDLPTRIANALRKGGYNTVGDLTRSTQNQVSLVKNLGGKSVTLVADALEKVGAAFRQEGGEE
jgi:DNA-directed RNA polymerase subunit alpha